MADLRGGSSLSRGPKTGDFLRNPQIFEFSKIILFTFQFRRSIGMVNKKKTTFFIDFRSFLGSSRPSAWEKDVFLFCLKQVRIYFDG